MHPDKIRNIFNLSSEDRYGYFIRKVADSEEVWLIKDGDSFPALGDNEEQVTIPVFPEQEFARFLLTGDWQTYSVKKMEVHDFIDWLDELEEQNIKIAGFPREDLKAVVVTADEMKNHLLYELQQYE
jgi:hypothetical protein